MASLVVSIIRKIMPVEFNEDYQGGTYQNGRFDRSGSQARQSKMALWLVKKHIAKDEKSANVILVCIALLFFALAIFIMYKFVL